MNQSLIISSLYITTSAICTTLLVPYDILFIQLRIELLSDILMTPYTLVEKISRQLPYLSPQLILTPLIFARSKGSFDNTFSPLSLIILRPLKQLPQILHSNIQ